MYNEHGLDLVFAILAQTAFELGRVGRAPPIIRHSFDIETKLGAAQPPVQREIAALDEQYLVARRKQIDERGFPSAVAGGGIAEDPMLGLEHALQPGKALFRNRLELGAGEIDR